MREYGAILIIIIGTNNNNENNNYNIKVNTYKTIILLVALYSCETWSLNLREEHRLRVF